MSTERPDTNHIPREPYRAYPELDARRPRLARLLASAATATIITGGGAAVAAFVEAGSGGVSGNALWAALLFGVIAGAKDYKTYTAKPPVHGDGKRP